MQDKAAFTPPSLLLATIALSLATFMQVLDTTIANVALPTIAGNLGVSSDQGTWVITSFAVCNAIALPLTGWFTRRFGQLKLFVGSVTLFTLTSFLCGFAHSMTELIIFRALQGFFAGPMFPMCQTLLLVIFPTTKRSMALALLSMVTVVAPIVGPITGGWITDNYSWRWVFFINIPVGIVTVLAIYQLLEDPPWERKSDKKLTIDWPGIGLIALGLGCLQVMLDRGEDEDWFASDFTRIFAVLTAVGIVGAIYWLLYAKKPVVDLRCMADKNFAVSSLLMAGMAMILYGSSVVIPQLAQQDLGYTATWSGLVLSPGAVLIVLTIPLVLKLMPIVQTRWIIAFGFFCLAASFWWSRTLTPDIDFETLMLFRSAQSIGLGFLFVPLTTIAFITIPRQLNADAAALFTMFRNVAGSVGISLSTAAITERSQAHSAHLAYNMSPLNEQFQLAVRESAQAIRNFTALVGDPMNTAMGQMYKTMIAQSRFLAYIDVFTLLSIVALLLIPFCLLLSPIKSEGSAGAH